MKVGVVGVGQTPFQMRATENHQEMTMNAFLDLREDSDVSREEIDNVVYSVYSDLLIRQHSPSQGIHDYLGLTGKPAIRTSAAASSGLHAVREGAIHVASGTSDVTLVMAVQKSSDVIDPETGRRSDGIINAQGITLDTTWEFPFSPMPPNLWAPTVAAHRERWGTPTDEQIARVTAKNYANAAKNPNALFSHELSVEDVLNSRRVATGCRLHDACLVGDWSAAVLLASEEKARELTDNPVWITGVGASHDTPTPVMDGEYQGRIPSIHKAGQQAYEMAGIEDPRSEFDVAEVHDIISWCEIDAYEGLGLAEPGEGHELVESGATELDGDLPVNPSGGRVACGHVAGVSGVYSAGEVALQLRGDAGDRQVDVSEGRGLVSAVGGRGPNVASAAVMERE
jgi:acetyl-CoA acetyltransferase